MKDKQLYLFGFNKDENKDSGRQKVVLPLDGIVLFVIIAVLIFTLSFSLGVEKGKKIASRNLKPQTVLAKEVIKPPVQEKIEVADVPLEEAPQPLDIGNLEVKTQDESEEAAGNKERIVYYIQVASFRKENTAYLEAKILKEKGYPVSVTRKGEYAVVYVGNFENEIEANNNFNSLRKRYKDCILREL